VDEIFEGPSLPNEQSSNQFELVINLALGLTMPSTLLARADVMIKLLFFLLRCMSSLLARSGHP
jgi:hypothetical protein